MTETNDRPHWIVFGFYLIAAVLIMYVSAGQRQPPPKTVAYSEFLTAIREGKLDSVRMITDSQLIGILKGTDEHPVAESITTPRMPQTDESWLVQDLQDREIKIIAQPPSTNWWSALLGWLFSHIYAVVPVFAFLGIPSNSVGVFSVVRVTRRSTISTGKATSPSKMSREWMKPKRN